MQSALDWSTDQCFSEPCLSHDFFFIHHHLTQLDISLFRKKKEDRKQHKLSTKRGHKGWLTWWKHPGCRQQSLPSQSRSAECWRCQKGLHDRSHRRGQRPHTAGWWRSEKRKEYLPGIWCSTQNTL